MLASIESYPLKIGGPVSNSGGTKDDGAGTSTCTPKPQPGKSGGGTRYTREAEDCKSTVKLELVRTPRSRMRFSSSKTAVHRILPAARLTIKTASRMSGLSCRMGLRRPTTTRQEQAPATAAGVPLWLLCRRSRQKPAPPAAAVGVTEGAAPDRTRTTS